MTLGHVLGTSRPTVALYVSGHGFGHAVRSACVASALIARGARVLVRTEAPSWLFPIQAECLPSPGWPVDVGVVQHDSLALDLEETWRRWQSFAAAFVGRARTEAAILQARGVHVVLGDIPPLAFAAAAEAGIPGVAVGNFGWDWIYAPWPGADQARAFVQEGYRQATVLLRLPFSSDDEDAFPAFRAVQDVPLIARRAGHSRAEVRSALGIPLDTRLVLLSFGGFDSTGMNLEALGAWQRYLFLVTPVAEADTPPSAAQNVRVLPPNQPDYASLVGACDAVVTKPGYGITADAIVQRVPVLYADRGPFREYPVLVKALLAHGHARHIPQEDVRAGRLGPHLDALLSTPATWVPMRTDGADVVAERVLALTPRV